VWIDKLTCGVLRILTALGPRYVTPSRPQRILLLWMCRHFHTLPQQVLSGWQQDLIDTLCAEHKFVSAPHDNAFEAAPICRYCRAADGSTGSAVFSAPGALRTFRLCHCAMVGHTTSFLTAAAAAVRLPCALREWQASASQPFRPAPPRGAGRTGRSCRLVLSLPLIIQPIDRVRVGAFAGDDDHTVYRLIFGIQLGAIRLELPAAGASNTILRRQPRSPGPVHPIIRALHIHDSH